MQKNKKETLEEKKLLEEIKKNPKKFDTLYIKYYPKIYNFVYQRVNQKHLVEDFVSDIFENAYKALQDFKWQGISFSAWLFRISRNYLIDYYRKVGRSAGKTSLDDLAEFIESDSLSVSEKLMIDEEVIDLYGSLREFNEEEQYLLYYKFFEELSNREISKIMNISETNVGTKLHRIKKRLKKHMETKSK